MAATTYTTNSPETRKAWSRKLFSEARKQSYVERFIGSGEHSLIQELTDLKKEKGDRITVNLVMQMTGAGVQGDNSLEGNEEALTTYTDNIFIDQLRHAARSRGKMSDQRVAFDVRERNKMMLADWFATRKDLSFFTQICGYTAPTLTLAESPTLSIDTRYTGLQVPLAPDASHYITAAGSGNDENITSSHKFSLSIIDQAVEKAKTLSPMIRPISYGGEKKYVMFLHPYNVYDLRTVTSTSTITWFDIQKAALANAKTPPNQSDIYTGALGEYNGVILHESNHVCNGVNSSTSAEITTVKRAVLCGAQAAAIAYGGEQDTGTRMGWYEEEFDYGNQLGVSAAAIMGLKKLRYNSKDFGTIVVSTYGVKHS
jgi:N4-gp56 family major capsid protein